MAKKLTSSKAKEILHDKSVHGQPLTDKQRRFFGAIAGGAKPYKAESGGWLDKYDAPKAQNGIEGTMGGLTDKGFNYNGAWGGTMQMGGSLTFLEPTSRKLPMGHAFPYKDPSTELAVSVGGEGGEPAYLIPSFKYGKLLNDPKAEFRKTGEHLGGPFKTWQEADEWERTVRHPYVEKGQSIPTPFRRWGKDFAMGGSLPGAVGFTYARTAGAAPANGPYAKKTKASAQVGKKVKYKELPEITVVGSKDKSTRDFYNNLINKFSEDSNSNNPYVDQEIMGNYLGVMDLGKKYGFPKVQPETNKGIFRSAKGHYNNLTETIYANDPNTWLSEMAHHVQMKDNVIGKGLQWLGNDLIEYAKQPIASLRGEELPSPYTTPGTVEHEAHSIIEPKLREEIKKSSKSYKKSPIAKGRKERFLAEKKMQNGGEMSYYQQGLDFKPKTISQDGTVIDPMGYWNPENVGNPVIIPSNEITMEGVDQPLIGISDTGDVQYMEPGEDYSFDGEYVTEYPVAQAGKRVPITVSDPKDPRLKAYQDSLTLYNFYEKPYRQRKKENNVESERPFKNFIGLNQTNEPGDVAQYYSNKKSTLFKKNEIHPIIEYSYREDSPEGFIDDIYYPARKNTEKFGFRFKKPVQPVEYKKPELPVLYVDNPNDPRLKRYQDSLQTYKNSKFGDFRGGDWTDPKGYTWTSKYPEADNYKPRPKKPI